MRYFTVNTISALYYGYTNNIIGRGGVGMKKTTVARNLSVRDAMSFTDLFEEISSDWELKAERLQNRRWRELKRRLA